MFLTVNEMYDRVEFQVSSLGEINARAFLTSMAYDTTNLILTDKTYLYDIPLFETQGQSTSQVISMPASFMTRFPNFFPGASMHLPVLEGNGLGMKFITTSIGLHDVTSPTVSLLAGEMLHNYSIHFRKVTPGKPVEDTDFGYFAQGPMVPMKPLASTMWTYYAMSIRNHHGQPTEWAIVKPQFFSFRSPSYVTTDAVTNNMESTTLYGTFTRGDLPPTDVLKTGYFKGAYNTKLLWDSITQYGFIYSNVNADIMVDKFTTQLNIDGIYYDFPNAAEIAANEFTRNGKTFFIQQIYDNYSTEQSVSFSQDVTGLSAGTTYYAWTFIHYTYETSYPHLFVGNKIMFTVDQLPFVYQQNLIYCADETVPEYVFEGTENTTFYWEKIMGYDFGLDVTEGVNTIPAFTAQNYGFEHVSAWYKVTPVSENGSVGTPQQFLITVNPKPVTSLVEDMVYCNGVTTPKFDFSSDMPNVNFDWEFVDEAGSVMIGGVPSFGENFIPSFMAYNTGNEPVVGKYRVRASFTYDNLTCYDDVWQYFHIIILPTPTAVSTPVHQTICSGETTLPVNFSGNITEVVYQWNRISGNVPDLPLSGTGNLAGYTLTNSGSVMMESVYEVTPMLNYSQYSGYSCAGNPTQFSISVLPQPHINTIPSMVYCSNEQTQSFEFGNTPGAIYSWQLINGVYIGLAENGTGQLPSFIAVNNSSNEVLEAIYEVTATYSMYGYECSHSVTFSIVVNPTPSVDMNIIPYQFCAGEETPVIDFIELFASLNNQEETIYEWHYISDNYIGLDQESGVNIIPSFVSINNSDQPVAATFKVKAKFGQCTSEEKTFKIIVNPIPQLSSPTFAGILCSETLFEYLITTNINVDEISWTRMPHPDINNNEGATGNNDFISEVLYNTSTSDVMVTYTIAASLGHCTNVNIGEVSVVVTPTIEFTINQRTIACSDEQFVTLEYDINIYGAQYMLVFEQEGHIVGFKSIMNYTPLPKSGIIVEIPQGVQWGHYTATFTLQYGSCIRYYDIVIAVTNAPVVTNRSESTIMLCDNEELYLFVEVEDDVQYQWYFNGVFLPDETNAFYENIFDITREGVYTVEISNECGSTICYFDVKRNPVMIKMKWNDVMYVPNADNLYVTYQWYKDGQPIALNGTNQYYTENGGFTLHTEYNVRAYKNDGSYDEACPIIPNVNPIPNGSGLTVYPNPTQSGSKITFLLTLPEGEWSDADAFIYNMNGKTITQFKITSNVTEMMIDVAAGVYTVRVITEKGNDFVDKIIILK